MSNTSLACLAPVMHVGHNECSETCCNHHATSRRLAETLIRWPQVTTEADFKIVQHNVPCLMLDSARLHMWTHWASHTDASPTPLLPVEWRCFFPSDSQCLSWLCLSSFSLTMQHIEALFILSPMLVKRTRCHYLTVRMVVCFLKSSFNRLLEFRKCYVILDNCAK